MRDNGGQIQGIVCVALDITDRERTEAALRESEQKVASFQRMEAIGTLAGGIAHDFNNLLMGIQGNASLMLYDIDSAHPHYDGLRQIEQLIKSGARLNSQLLGYARKGRYEVKPINLNQLVEQTTNTFGRAKKEIMIRQKLQQGLCAVEADQGQIEQVLMNLYVNAADAMPDGGNLILKTVNVTHENMKGGLYNPKPGNYVLLEVTDTGIGMDKITKERIFDPFFTTKEMGRGTGLGLASVYGIIKGHGGYIDVYSEKGNGSTFNVYLPALDQKTHKYVETEMECIQGNGTVLLVDDEKAVLDVGAKLLKKLGYTILTAGVGREAVEVYKEDKENIDIVILDMIMPDMGGGEVYDRIREINPKVRVLLSSGYTIEGKATEILMRGCDGFIQKPFSIEELSERIKEVLAKQ
jgi:nitrogen-specific signal transduction histidine kinase/CheY-like chemotaxis protein